MAYFSIRFGLHESLPIYSGGLGVLAGDHLTAPATWAFADRDRNFCTIRGTSAKRSTPTRWQQENYLKANPELRRSRKFASPMAQPLTIAIELNVGTLHARVWRVDVGRTTLYLLNSNVPENSESDRALTSRLYGGDARIRIRQELLLGVGGDSRRLLAAEFIRR